MSAAAVPVRIIGRPWVAPGCPFDILGRRTRPDITASGRCRFLFVMALLEASGGNGTSARRPERLLWLNGVVLESGLHPPAFFRLQVADCSGKRLGVVWLTSKKFWAQMRSVASSEHRGMVVR
jgi:hypothetical protein